MIVEILVLHIFKPNFLLGSIPLAFSWKEALLTAAICLAVFLTATYVACANLVRLPATTLLRGEVPVKGKSFFFEKWNSYKKLNLYSRTMIKNVLNDKGRMMTTVMGVVGCISLLVIDSSFGERDEFEKVLDEEDISYTVIQDKLKNFRTNGGGWENAHVIAVSDFKELEKYMVVEDIHTKELAEIPDDGVFVSRKCAELNDLSEGSTVEFMDSEGNAREVKIVGVIEHYLPYHLFVTSDSYYESVMEEKTDFSVFLLKGDITGLYEKVRDLDGYLSLKDNSEFEKSADGVNLVILICLLLSAVMALLVLLNQIFMHINRKSRELAVMRINGYTLKDLEGNKGICLQRQCDSHATGSPFRQRVWYRIVVCGGADHRSRRKPLCAHTEYTGMSVCMWSRGVVCADREPDRLEKNKTLESDKCQWKLDDRVCKKAIVTGFFAHSLHFFCLFTAGTNPYLPTVRSSA